MLIPVSVSGVSAVYRKIIALSKKTVKPTPSLMIACALR
jgi:hypothetical protein